MRPAASVIFFTVLSGMGFGLIAWLGLGLEPRNDGFAFAAFAGLALALIGLIASIFHLGNPRRAWRALTQWRSSWLSREGVLATSTMALFAAYVASDLMLGAPIRGLGLAASISALATVGATAMIYAQLRTVPRWNTRLTLVCYLLFAIAGGALWAALIAEAAGRFQHHLAMAALIALAAAWMAKLAWWARADRIGLADAGSTPETATGLSDLGRVRLLEAPHSSPNYLMREMVFVVGRKHARALRILAVALGGAAPAICLMIAAVAGGGWGLLPLAVAAHGAGMFAERWLFFAEAEHTVSLYYGAPLRPARMRRLAMAGAFDR